MSFLVNPHVFAGAGGGGSDPFWADVVLQIQPNDTDGSTTFVDQKNARTITAVGNAQINNNELLLDGTGDYLTLVDQADWDLGGEFCIDVWATFESLTTAQSILAQYSPDAKRAYNFSYQGGGTPKQLAAALWSSPSDSGSVVVTAADFTPADTVTRYAIRWERTGSTLRIFVDGVMIGSDTNAVVTTANDILAIGMSNSSTPSAFMTGRIKALRFTKASRHGSDANYTVESLPLPTS